MIAVLIVFLAANEKRNLTKKNQNEIANRQIWDSVTVSNPVARKINTLLSLPIHRACRRSAAASVVVSNTLDAWSILLWRLCCRYCSLCDNLPPPTTLSSLYITWARCLATAASVVVSDPLDAPYIPRPLLTPPLSPLSTRARLTLPTPPSSSSTPWSRKCTGASTSGDVHSDALYLLLPKFNPPFLLSKHWSHLPLPTPPLWLTITQARHRDAAASVVVPEYLIPWTHFIFLVLYQRLCCRCWLRGPFSEILLNFG